MTNKMDFDFLEPQITQMTLIFKQLQIEQIYTEILNAPPFDFAQEPRMNYHRLADAAKKMSGCEFSNNKVL